MFFEVEQYPYLYDLNSLDGLEESDLLPIHSIEWGSLVKHYFDKINTVLEEHGYSRSVFQIGQLKEKFGACRLYWTACVDKSTYELIDQLVRELEYISSNTCHKCCSTATHISFGWILPYCKKCAEEVINHRNAASDKHYHTLQSDFKSITYILN